jgi:hypothetical protein
VSKPTTLAQLNDIAELFIKGNPPTAGRVGSRIFGLGEEETVFVHRENVEVFDKAVGSLLDSLTRIKGTLSRGVFVDKLIPLIRERKLSGKEFTRHEAEEFERMICDLPLQKYRVIREIFGVMLTPGTMPLTMGDFQIGFGTDMFRSVRERPIVSQTMKPEDFEKLYIECSVDARDEDRALEIADVLFHRFELIFRVLIGRRTRYLEVGVLNYVGPQLRASFALVEDGRIFYGSGWQGALQPVPLNDPYFSLLPAPFPRLFELVSQQNNELEKHVVRCAEWTGEAIGDRNAATAFVKGAIALEVMFSASEKGIITPSIMAQIAESCALLLGHDEVHACKVEREVKRLYSIRSSVVHSGKDTVDETDLDSLVRVCGGVITALLSREEFIDIKNMSGLADYFKRRKYSGMIHVQRAAQV